MHSYPVELPVKKHGLLKKAERIIKGQCFYHAYFNENRCIFIHIPKAAGTSIGLALFGDGQPGHRLAMDYYLESSRKFSDYFSFTFVRNPYDRLFSAYRYLIKGGKSPRDISFRDQYMAAYPDFQSFVLQGLEKPELISWIHFRPQSQFLIDFHGKIAVDFIGRYENLDEDFARIAERLGKQVQLPHSNASGNPQLWKQHFTTEMLTMTEQVYAMDFELLGYPLLSANSTLPTAQS